MSASSTVENYLKAIYTGSVGPGGDRRVLPMGHLATALGVTPGTATTMVKPNSWKNLPMMPPMKPIGMNTATMDSVVASTAKPISCVPSMAA